MIDFYNIKGCEIIEHRDQYVKENRKVPYFVRAAARLIQPIMFFSSIPFLLWCFSLSPTKTYLFLALFLCVWALLGFLGCKTTHPEQYTLRFTDELSAKNLLEIQREYDIDPDKKENLWIATAKKTSILQKKGEKYE